MATVQEFWRPIINDFRPVGTIHPDEVARFFIDRQEGNPTRSLLQLLAVSLQNSLGQPKPYKGLLTGHTGSGKSSELLRLGQELGNDFFVVWFDAETTLATETANHFDVLLAMGLAVHAAAYAAGLEPEEARAKAFLQSFAKFVRKFENRKGFSLKLDQVLKQVAAFALSFLGAPPTVLPITEAILNTSPLELKVNDDLVRTLELPANRQEIMGALNKIIEGVQEKAAGKPLLIITDGLDKVPSSRARQFFSTSSLLTEPACALVYAAPIEFYHSLHAGHVTNLFDEYCVLPNVIVQKRPLTGEHWKAERDPNESGVEVLRRVVTKRLAAHEKTVDDVIKPQAFSLMARASGGVIRGLIRSCHDAMRLAQVSRQYQIDEAIVEKVIDQQRQLAASQLKMNHINALRHVLQQGRLSGGEFESIEDELMRGSYLLSYQDPPHSWFDAHPNVLPLL